MTLSGCPHNATGARAAEASWRKRVRGRNALQVALNRIRRLRKLARMWKRHRQEVRSRKRPVLAGRRGVCPLQLSEQRALSGPEFGTFEFMLVRYFRRSRKRAAVKEHMHNSPSAGKPSPLGRRGRAARPNCLQQARTNSSNGEGSEELMAFRRKHVASPRGNCKGKPLRSQLDPPRRTKT